MFIVLSGVSSSGKNTIMKELATKRKDLKILEQSSATTRPPRESDKEHNTYLFMSKEEFEKKIQSGEFFEHELVHDNYYGMFNSALEKVVDDKSCDYIRDIDVKGCVNLKRYFEGKSPILSIFIDAPNDVLRERLLYRGDNPMDIEKRLGRAEMERAYKGNYDLIVENIDLEKSVNIINDFIDDFKNKN